MKKLLTIALLTVALAGCSYEPQQRLNVADPTKKQSSRVVIERIAVVDDTLAYKGERGIYVITDTKTGKEFIGISGVGITEVGSHTRQVGKTTTRVEDER